MNPIPNPNAYNLIPAYPELLLFIMISLIMVVDAFWPKASKGDDAGSGKSRALFWLSILALAMCGSLSFAMLGLPERSYAFTNMFVIDQMANLLKLGAYLAVGVSFVYSRRYMAERALLSGEFYHLSLFALLGGMIMISANNFLMLYLGLELLSLSLYAMVALNRDSVVSTEAAIKYFVLGALASGLLLYGMSMIYGASGTLEIGEIAKALANGVAKRNMVLFGLVFAVAGLAFKLGVVPFHMWIPDVYHGAPTPVTLMVGAAPKLAAFAIMVRLLVNGLSNVAADWQQMLVILAVLSLAVGNLGAIAQTNIKRMLAYSTISHMGFVLLGLSSGVVDGNRLSAATAYGSSLFYIITYTLTTLASFGMVLLLARQGFEADKLDDFKGLNARSPWFAGMMGIVMFSLAGLPPTVGFYAKLAVLEAAVSAHMAWLAVVAVVFSLIGAFYYLRIIKLMYFDEPLDKQPIVADAASHALLSINGVALLALGLLPGALMGLCVVAMGNSL
ncbi:MAG: NADH-quinone oxidoreductase subunit [Betaproteobacteria bacterium]|nr:NADH-quinone oxidoreductase subunit [Betaproteobacteria bacterium]